MGSNKFFCYLETEVWQYKGAWMIAFFGALNNIRAYKLFHLCCTLLSNSYHYQTLNNLDKFIEQEVIDNTYVIFTSIFIVIQMHIWPTKFLEDNVSNTQYDLEESFYEQCAGLD